MCPIRYKRRRYLDSRHQRVLTSLCFLWPFETLQKMVVEAVLGGKKEGLGRFFAPGASKSFLQAGRVASELVTVRRPSFVAFWCLMSNPVAANGVASRQNSYRLSAICMIVSSCESDDYRTRPNLYPGTDSARNAFRTRSGRRLRKNLRNGVPVYR